MGESIELKNVFITGASGYLGGCISNYLEAQGFTITRGIRHSEARPDATSKFDVLSQSSCLNAFAGQDAVVHLAALNEIESAENPARAIEVNGTGVLNVVKACRDQGVRRVIYFSTAHAYGVLSGHVMETRAAQPQHPYAYTHLLGEGIVRTECLQSSLSGLSLRLSNSFGPPVDPNVNRWSLLVNDLCRQAVSTRELVLTSPGVQFRDFIGMTDVCRAVEHTLVSQNFESCKGDIFNLGGNQSFAVREIASVIASRAEKLLGQPIAVRIPSPQSVQTPLPLPLNFDSSRFKGTGFEWKSVMIQEIDETLRFCLEHFPPKENL